MRTLNIEKLEDCFDGSSVFRYHTEQPWTENAIAGLAELGALDYFRDFPRPYFRVRGEGGLEVKGLEGECSCRVTLPRTGREKLRQRWEKFLQDSLRVVAR